jgi:uncharacterized damage-inducible protein DinB
MDHLDELRAHLVKHLEGKGAHATFDAAVKGIPPEYYGALADGMPYTLWQLLEHIRLAQWDILDFCRNPDYKELKWPDDYWPRDAAPTDQAAWDASIASFRADLDAMKQLASDPATDLFARIPHGTGQTYLREVLLVADHNAYHVGQLVLLRRALGIWG